MLLLFNNESSFVLPSGLEMLVVRDEKPIPGFDPFRTSVVRVIYEQFPGYEEVCNDLRRKDLLTLGLKELVATANLIEELSTLPKTDPEVEFNSRRWNKWTKEVRRIMELQFERKKQLLQQLSTTHIGDTACRTTQSLYVGTVLCETHPLLQQYRSYPLFCGGGRAYRSEHVVGHRSIYNQFFMADIACTKQ